MGVVGRSVSNRRPKVVGAADGSSQYNVQHYGDTLCFRQRDVRAVGALT